MSVLSAVKSSKQNTSTARGKTLSAIKTVVQDTDAEKERLSKMRIKSIKYAGKADVYNMEVEETHDFVIQGGVISHNCADETRYMCMANPIKPVKPVEKKVRMYDPLSTEEESKPSRYSYMQYL